MPFTQDQHLIGVNTNAGKDVLLLDSFAGQEGISQPFRFDLKMLSEIVEGNPAKVKQHDLVGTSMTVRIALSEPGDGRDTGFRYWTGLCESFVKANEDDNFAYFSAVLVPWFSFLKYASNCRIFTEKNVTDIIQEVVKTYGYSSMLRLETTKSYTPRDYCVQYRETDFAFLSRLMEDEGIYYYFEHTDGKHVMVLADSPACYKPQPNRSDYKYSPVVGMQSTEDTIISWQLEERMHPGKWTSRDFHHEAPHNFLERTEPSTSVAAEGKKFEAYDPGEDAKFFNKVGSFAGAPNEAATSVRVRMEKEEASEKIARGESKGRAFTSGYKIQITGGDAAGSYLLTSLSHVAFQLPGYQHMDMARPGYRNAFSAMNAGVPYAPQQLTGRSVVYGLQTAFVIDESPSGNTEEIWPDKYGRVRVRFHWDREAKYSCWLRVVQPWAGRSWGQQWIPRVGDEVAVTFLEGDPDLPVVVGSVYNAENMPIFKLPDNKTQSGIQTHSSTGGGSSNFNMLRFEDKDGSEEIFMQAEKDQNVIIKHDETHTVKNNRTTTIHVNDARTVETGNDTLTVEQGNRKITVSQGTITEYAQGQISVESVTGITIKCGGSSIQITPTGITLSTGASSISMTPGSTDHTAPMITLNS
jgi:type VI secretion system secreted protein VgrG